MLNKIIMLPRKIFVSLIKVYQKCISPSIGARCKYYPTCSEYTRQAIDKYGIIKGSFLGIKRILKCNPFSHGGVDKLK
jgi:putative membrane protein insertion efficiency factor